MKRFVPPLYDVKIRGGKKYVIWKNKDGSVGNANGPLSSSSNDSSSSLGGNTKPVIPPINTTDRRPTSKRRSSYPPSPDTQQKNRKLDLEGIVLRTDVARALKTVSPQTMMSLKSDLEQADSSRKGYHPAKLVRSYCKKKHQLPLSDSRMDILLDRFRVPRSQGLVDYPELITFLVEAKASKGTRGLSSGSYTPSSYFGDRTDAKLVLELESALRGQVIDPPELLRELHDLDRDRNNFLSKQSVEKALAKSKLRLQDNTLDRILDKCDTKNCALYSIPKFIKYFERIQPEADDALRRKPATEITPPPQRPPVLEPLNLSFDANAECKFDEGYPLMAEAIRKNDIDVIGYMPKDDVSYYVSMYNLVYNMGISDRLLDQTIVDSSNPGVVDGEVDVERFLSLLKQRRLQEMGR
ncbi:Uncharacterised protein g2608 [Pycnogonum litorale]